MLKRHAVRTISFSATLLAFFYSGNINAAQIAGMMQLVVQSALTLSKIEDLDFGEGFTGDSAKIVEPTSGAGFRVTGEPHRCFHVLLPDSLMLTRADGRGGNQQIRIHSFRANPSQTGILDESGFRSLYVGATRDPLPNQQAPGRYSANFTVTITYQ